MLSKFFMLNELLRIFTQSDKGVPNEASEPQFEERTWGAFRTEFYPTYDFKQAFLELKTRE